MFFPNSSTAMNRKTMIEDIFTTVASRYDLMNDIMSLGIHRMWKKRIVEKVIYAKPNAYLDLATGSGDIALAVIKKYLKNNQNPSKIIVLADQNQAMLTTVKENAINHGMYHYIKDFVLCSSEDLPFPDESFDCITVSFGVRNFTNIQHSMQEIHRVLKPGGKFFCLEFSPTLTNSYLQKAYRMYSKMIPKIGKIIANSAASYAYLVSSINEFLSYQEFADLLKNTGFCFVDWDRLSCGICNIHTAFKAGRMTALPEVVAKGTE